MTLFEIYDKRAESIHDFQIDNGNMADYVRSQKGTVTAYTTILNEATVIICLEAIIKANGREFLRFDCSDGFIFKSYVDGRLEQMEITDALMKSTLRSLRNIAEIHLNGGKKTRFISFKKGNKKNRRTGNINIK